MYAGSIPTLASHTARSILVRFPQASRRYAAVRPLLYCRDITDRGIAMSEETSSLTNLRCREYAPTPSTCARVGAHPDYWYPVAWSDELKPGKVLGRRFAGEPIAIYRGESGQVFALEDRCAHRQVPLHLGVVSGR